MALTQLASMVNFDDFFLISGEHPKFLIVGRYAFHKVRRVHKKIINFMATILRNFADDPFLYE